MTTKPVLLTEAEIEQLHLEVGRSSLMGKTIAANAKDLEAFMRLPIDVPGHGEAGGKKKKPPQAKLHVHEPSWSHVLDH